MAVEYHGELDRNRCVGTENPASVDHMIGGHEVRMGACGTITSKSEHSWSECTKDSSFDWNRNRSGIKGVQKLDHLGVRLGVATGMSVVDQGGGTYSETERNAMLPGRAPHRAPTRDFGRVLHPCVENACRHSDSGSCLQQDLHRSHDVTPHIGDPDRAVAELVEFPCRLGNSAGIAIAHLRRPHADSVVLHRLLPGFGLWEGHIINGVADGEELP